LAERFGAAGTADLATRRQYAISGVVPALVARPADAAELAAMVGEVDAAGAALVPIGRGAHRGLGHAPRHYDVALVSERLSRVHAYTSADMTVTVEAGVTLTELDALLAREGQWLPLDPALPASTTVGGLLAADLAGPLAASQGRVRDYVIGIAVVTAAGVVARAGGRVVKNVAGYDLMKLFIGSLGTLAVVTDATFKVRPRPEQQRWLVFVCPTLVGAVELGATVDAARIGALAVTARGTVGGVARLVVRLGGVPADVAVARTRVVELAASSGADLDLDADDAPAEARAHRDFVREETGDLVVRLAVLPARLAALVAALPAVAGGAIGTTQCDPLRGTLALALTTAEPEMVLTRLGRLVDAHGAHLVVERWPAALAPTIAVWRPSPAALPLMRRVKEALDPRGTLAPGRFVGRL
jgi:glycolate oxidase FAD binding subunit